MFGNFNGRLRGKSLILQSVFEVHLCFAGSVFLWLGGSITASANTSWATGETWLYSNWFPGEPTISSDPCLSYLVQNNTVASEWGILDCMDVREYLCEKALVKP